MKSFYFLIAFFWFAELSAQFRIYPSSDNQIAQSVIQTSDNGFLIASIAFCYTPDEWVIEGCPLGIYLVRTNSQGETVWAKQIVNHEVIGPIKLFEQPDGSFTVIASQDGTYQCHDWTIGPDFGLLQIVTYHVSSSGETLTETSFPDNCQLAILDVEKNTDTTYAVLARYTEPFASEYVEGRLFIMDDLSEISDSITFPGEPLMHGQISVDSQKIYLFYADSNNVLRLRTYDDNLVLQEEHSNQEVGSSCFTAEENTSLMALLSNGNLFMMCHNPYAKGQNVELFSFNRDLELLSNQSYTIPFSSSFEETDKHEIVIVSEARSEQDSSDIRLSYFTLEGDSLYTVTYSIPGYQAPTQALNPPGDELIVVGTHNCCNLSSSIGPGTTFMFFTEETTSSKDIFPHDAMKIFPNPAHDQITLALKDEMNKSQEDLEAEIYSAQGVLMIRLKLDENMMIPLDHLANGTYYVAVSKGDLIIHREIVVKQD